jgi:hypothetical protein
MHMYVHPVRIQKTETLQSTYIHTYSIVCMYEYGESGVWGKKKVNRVSGDQVSWTVMASDSDITILRGRGQV